MAAAIFNAANKYIEGKKKKYSKAFPVSYIIASINEKDWDSGPQI